VTDTITSPAQPTGRTGRTSQAGRTGTVLIRYFAGARAAAGVAEEHVTGPMGTVADVLAAAQGRRGTNLARVLLSCSFLLNGVAVHDRAESVPDGAELDVLPPFAGG
jgi:molybdopterin converting factor small subunit